MNILNQRIYIDRYLIRILIVGLLIAFFVSTVFWGGRLFARILDFPELRHEILIQPAQQGNLNVAQLRVTNFGFGPAQKVLIHVNVSDARIRRYQIDAQEMYEVKTHDLQQGVLDIWLDRLASSAGVDISIAAENLSQEEIQLSAVSDQGSSTSIDVPTFSDQARAYSTFTGNVFNEAWKAVLRSNIARDYSSWVPAESSLAAFLSVVGEHDFQTIAIAVLIVVLFIGIFFRYEHFIFAVFLGAWLLTWALFAEIPLSWLIGTIGGLVTVLYWRLFLTSLRGLQNLDWLMLVVLCFILLGLPVGLGFAVWYYWYIWLPVDFLTSLLAGISIAGVVYWAGFLR